MIKIKKNIRNKMIFLIVSALLWGYYVLKLEVGGIDFFLLRFVLILGTLGAICNFLAISSNGWKMPVHVPKERRMPKYETVEHTYFKNSNVKYRILCDIIHIRFKNKKKKLIGLMSISVGDIFLYTSIFLISIFILRLFFDLVVIPSV